MTALNVIFTRDRAFVLTDSANYDLENVVQFFQRKAEMIPDFKMVVASRGDHRLPSCLADGMADWYSNMDELVADEAWRIESAYLNTIAQVETVDVHAEIVIVGWSDEKAMPVCILLALGGDRRFEIIDGGIASPWPGPRELNELRLLRAEPGVDWTPDTFDPRAHGIALLETQRRMKAPLKASGGHGYCVGGEVHLTTLTAHSITQEVIHRWEADEIGDTIHPQPFVPPAITGGNRQHRRAAERMAKKLNRRAA